HVTGVQTCALPIYGAREELVALRGEGRRECVHGLAPGPERPAAGVRAPAQGAVEGVRVDVGEAGQHEPGQADVLVGRRRAGPDGDDPPVRGLDAHGPGDAVGQPGPLAPVAGHALSSSGAGAGSPVSRSVSTAVRASTPAAQSSGSACSAGEWETPVGLRTNSIAVGTPAAARMPASCPAPVPITGAGRSESGRPTTSASRAASAGSKTVAGVHDSWTSPHERSPR